jgi:hypothetical protein
MNYTMSIAHIRVMANYGGHDAEVERFNSVKKTKPYQ